MQRNTKRPLKRINDKQRDALAQFFAPYTGAMDPRAQDRCGYIPPNDDGSASDGLVSLLHSPYRKL